MVFTHVQHSVFACVMTRGDMLAKPYYCICAMLSAGCCPRTSTHTDMCFIWQVTLNGEARPAMMPCFAIFDSPTLIKIGYTSFCNVDGSQITVKLGGNAILLPGDNITLAASQAAVVAAVGDAPARFHGSVVVQRCNSCPSPNAVLQVSTTQDLMHYLFFTYCTWQHYTAACM